MGSISRTMRVQFSVMFGVFAVSALAVSSVSATANTDEGDPQWQLVYEETFDTPLLVDDQPWIVDPHGDNSPWHVDHLDDDGEFFHAQGGSDFVQQLAGAHVLRKRVAFGDSGWLTAEVAARDYNMDGMPDGDASLSTTAISGDSAALLKSGQGAGVVVRNSEALPSQYRIEYTLKTLDYGGKRDGSWDYQGLSNGYNPDGCNTNWPWKRSGDFSGPVNRCNSKFGDVRAENGYYFLSIMDYQNPAPHNNVFIHNHRKVGMDVYSVNGLWSASYTVCNPATGVTFPYADSTANGINSIFFDGSRFKSPDIGYNEFIMPTECGLKDGADPKATIVSAAEVQPELMPMESYQFAIERDTTGYTMEMSGNFKYLGNATLSYHRDFVQDSRPIWHYNQHASEYDGSFNSTLTFSGPYGSYQKEQWPAGSAYPDYFIIGDPHLNYYEGSATIDDLRMYVSTSASTGDQSNG